MVIDIIRGKAINIVRSTTVRRHPSTLGWLERGARVNELPPIRVEPTQRLRSVDETGVQETWHAGRDDLSIGNGYERMANTNAAQRDCVVVVPLRERIYFAYGNGALVSHEGTHCPLAFDELASARQAFNRKFVLLTEPVRQPAELSPSIDLSLNFDSETLPFQNAPIAMFRKGIFNSRICALE